MQLVSTIYQFCRGQGCVESTVVYNQCGFCSTGCLVKTCAHLQDAVLEALPKSAPAHPCFSVHSLLCLCSASGNCYVPTRVKG